jgi:hypothetical protein
LKVAFDENLPKAKVALFQMVAKDEGLDLVIVSARKYRPRSERGDQNWIRRFAKSGGQVIISGDGRMRAHLHEQAALSQARLITFFFEGRWSQDTFFVKTAMLLKWWPKIMEVAANSKPGDFWEIPYSWNWKDMRNVRPKTETPTATSGKKSGRKIP